MLVENQAGCLQGQRVLLWLASDLGPGPLEPAGRCPNWPPRGRCHLEQRDCIPHLLVARDHWNREKQVGCDRRMALSRASWGVPGASWPLGSSQCTASHWVRATLAGSGAGAHWAANSRRLCAFLSARAARPRLRCPAQISGAPGAGVLPWAVRPLCSPLRLHVLKVLWLQ